MPICLSFPFTNDDGIRKDPDFIMACDWVALMSRPNIHSQICEGGVRGMGDAKSSQGLPCAPRIENLWTRDSERKKTHTV